MNPYEEELAWYWVQTIGTDYETSQIYRDNFMTQFGKSIQARHPEAIKLELFDFSDMRSVYDKERLEKKSKPEEEKAKNKLEKDEIGKFYMYAIVDGTIEKVNGYQIEPPTLFKGRGKHPKAGFLKPRIQPE